MLLLRPPGRCCRRDSPRFCTSSCPTGLQSRSLPGLPGQDNGPGPPIGAPRHPATARRARSGTTFVHLGVQMKPDGGDARRLRAAPRQAGWGGCSCHLARPPHLFMLHRRWPNWWQPAPSVRSPSVRTDTACSGVVGGPPSAGRACRPPRLHTPCLEGTQTGHSQITRVHGCTHLRGLASRAAVAPAPPIVRHARVPPRAKGGGSGCGGGSGQQPSAPSRRRQSRLPLAV